MRGRFAVAFAVMCTAFVVPASMPGAASAPACTKTGTAYADVMTGTPGPDVLCGLGGGDTLKGVGGDDILIGGPGADNLPGGDGADVLDGGDANDTFLGGDGADVFAGGAGSDLVRYDDRSVGVVVSVGHGADDGYWPGLEGDDVRADIERVNGSKADDRLVAFGGTAVQFYGKTGNDELIGGPSTDLLQGDAGNDLLIGHGSRDTVNCGFGRDSYRFDSADVRQGCEVLAANRAPVTGTDEFDTDEDTVLQVSVLSLLANDGDPDMDPITLTGATGASHGSVSLSGSTVTFTPAANFNDLGGGRGSFVYTVSDGQQTTQERAYVDVASVVDPPVAVDDAVETTPDHVLTLTTTSLLANDVDPDGTLRITLVGGATNGAVTLNSDKVRFTPTPGFCGSAGFDYTVFDGMYSDIGHVAVAVTCPPPPPPPPHIIAGDDQASGFEDTLLAIPVSDLLAHDVDVRGPPLTITRVFGDQGEAWIDGDTVYFMPNPEEWGDDAKILYVVSDGKEIGVADVELWLEPTNDAPIAGLSWGGTEMNQPMIIDEADVLTHSYDPDIDPIFLARVENPEHGTVVLSGQTVTFDPEPGFCGVAGFDFVVSDGELETTGPVQVYVDGPGTSC